MVETLDKWEKEFEIDIRIMLTGKATQRQNILFCSLGLQATPVVITTTFSTSRLMPAVGSLATSPPPSTSTEGTGTQGPA